MASQVIKPQVGFYPPASLFLFKNTEFVRSDYGSLKIAQTKRIVRESRISLSGQSLTWLPARWAFIQRWLEESRCCVQSGYEVVLTSSRRCSARV